MFPPGSEAAYKTAAVWKEFVIAESPAPHTPPTHTAVNPADGRIKVSVSNSVLSVSSPSAERISVYTVRGTLLHSAQKPAGETFLTVNHFQGILIVRGSSGWIRKLIIDN
jgi:hypothetical protein